MDYERLMEYAVTDRQKYILTKLQEGKTQERIAKELKVSRTAVTHTLKRIRNKAAKQEGGMGAESPSPADF